VPQLSQSFEVFVDRELSFRAGVLGPSPDNRLSFVINHMVPLPRGYHGRTLMLRVYSDVPEIIGRQAEDAETWVGTGDDLVKNLFWLSPASTWIGILLIFLGLFSILIFVTGLKLKFVFPFSFGIFATMMGVFFVLFDPLTIYLIPSPWVKVYLRIGSFALFPVGLYLFLEHIVTDKRVVRALWMLHLAYAAVLLTLMATNVPQLITIIDAYNYVFLGTIVVAIIVATRAATGGNYSARVFVCGFIVSSVTGLHDILMGLGIIPFWRWMSAWGALVFVLALGYILERHVAADQRRLRKYSAELERKSQQLEEYSHTLEDKVRERTKDLNARNEDLATALDQLRETQEQLVMQEKMASLGNLVAGVAHEVNNPIGAVTSAADVSKRCIGIVRATAAENPDLVGGAQESKFAKAVRILADNNRIVTTAAARIAAIVKSLKNFSRLDEAEFQKTDIHEGIESTLTLIHHELKGRVEVVKQFCDIPGIDAYPNQLNQVFMNLFVNASHAMQGTGTLTITTSTDDANVYIAVADTGKGIPQEDVAHIFDPGFTTKGVGVGTGLGLSISYKIIKKHGGELTVKSEVGKGTEFTVSLPI
jgi:signal transduction histidine kinase